MRHYYLISYDIADPARLRKVHKIVRDFGDRLQFSVFLCELSPRELALVRERLTDAVHHVEDQVLFVRLSPVSETDDLSTRFAHLGRPPDLPDDEPMVY